MLSTFCDKKIQPIIDKAFQDIAAYLNAAVPCMSMVRDVIADKAVWTAKKRYIMNIYEDDARVRYEKPKLKMMGIEAIKSSTPSIVRKMITDGLQLFMTGTKEDVWAHVAKCEAEFKKASFEDIAFPRSVNGIKKYQTIQRTAPIHVAGAIAFNAMLERSGLTDVEPIRDGEKIKFAYLRQPNPFHSHVISALQGCPAAWQVEKWLDYDQQFQKTFVAPFQAIIECAGWTTEEEPSLW